MSLFAVGLAIAGVSVTFSDDIKQRTLYLVFSKKVSRLQYLIGKWLGVMVAVFVGLVLIGLAFSVVLNLRESAVLAEQIALAEEAGVTGEVLQRLSFEIEAEGFQWALWWGVLAIFAKALVVGVLAIFMVCVSRSAIFAMGATMFVVLIGMFQADAFSAMHFEGASGGVRIGAGLVALLFPDMQAYDALDWASVMKPDAVLEMGRLGLRTAGYLFFYFGVSWLRFRSREL